MAQEGARGSSVDGCGDGGHAGVREGREHGAEDGEEVEGGQEVVCSRCCVEEGEEGTVCCRACILEREAGTGTRHGGDGDGRGASSRECEMCG